jgi:hypothetical protein
VDKLPSKGTIAGYVWQMFVVLVGNSLIFSIAWRHVLRHVVATSPS